MNKSELIHIRLTEQDKNLIKEAAAYTRLDIGAYVRMIVLKDAESRVSFFRKIGAKNGKADVSRQA